MSEASTTADASEVIVPSVIPPTPAASASSDLSSEEIGARLQRLKDSGIEVVSMKEIAGVESRPSGSPNPFADFSPEKAGINTKGLIAVGSDLPKGFAIENTRYAIYDYDVCAPWGALQGYLLSFETWVEAGESRHAAIVMPTVGAIVLAVTPVQLPNGMIAKQITPRRTVKDDLVIVHLFEAPERLRKFVTQAWVPEVQFRAAAPAPNRHWVIATHEDQISRAKLNLI
jgi:hypothetical protein